MNSLDLFSDEQLINLIINESLLLEQLCIIVTLQNYFNSHGKVT